MSINPFNEQYRAEWRDHFPAILSTPAPMRKRADDSELIASYRDIPRAQLIELAVGFERDIEFYLERIAQLEAALRRLLEATQTPQHSLEREVIEARAALSPAKDRK